MLNNHAGLLLQIRSQRRHLRLICRCLAAIFGGYAMATAFVIFIGGLAGHPRADAIVLAATLSFCIYAMVAIWAFSVRRVARMCMQVTALSALLSGLGFLLARSIP